MILARRYAPYFLGHSLASYSDVNTWIEPSLKSNKYSKQSRLSLSNYLIFTTSTNLDDFFSYEIGDTDFLSELI